jgi:hypothetical protein
MYKNLTRFTASNSPAARRSLARVIIIRGWLLVLGLKEGLVECATVQCSLKVRSY